jgi:uncharacterized lipoprotein YbaY
VCDGCVDATVEGVVENGQIRLRERVTLPENAKVYVIVPDADAPARIYSPRLAHPEQAAQFAKQVTGVRDNGGL